MLTTDALIIGSGPAGSTTALALSTLGVPNVVVTKYRWLANAPRAHMTSQRTMEILRDLGVEREAREKATPQELMGETVFCLSLAGEELGRLRSFGTHPSRMADYALASPCRLCDLPQNLLEPVLLGNACARGSVVRFETEYVSMSQDADGVTATVRDRSSGATYPIRARYLIGADGANSVVAAELGLPTEGRMGERSMITFVVHADLSRYAAHRPGSLFWVVRPDQTIGASIGSIRMVRPWDQWVFSCRDGGNSTVDEARATKIAHALIGDATIPVEVKSISTWTLNQQHATRYSQGRVFCMGDAVHRLPPNNGLGSNTAIQDAYNLGWKLALVLGGRAAPSLLDSYDQERAPVGRQAVERASKSAAEFRPLLDALGFKKGATTEQVLLAMEGRKAATAAAADQRAQLKSAISLKSYELNALGAEMNQRYRSSAVIPDGTPEPAYERDADLYYQATTWPGARLPHVWLGRLGRRVSSLDVVGKGRFALFTGIGGEAWVAAARAAAAAYRIELDALVVGPGCELTDLYGDWADARGTDDSGCLLVRPDAHVAFRQRDATSAAGALGAALAQILGTPGV